MAKSHYNIRINSEVWEEFQLCFPNKASSMIEEFFSSCISSLGNGTNRKDLIQELSDIEKQEATAKARKISIEKELQIAKEKETQKRELFNSDQAEQRRKDYMQINSIVRSYTADVVEELKKANITKYGEPLYPFNFYFDVVLNVEIFSDLMKYAEQKRLYQLNAYLLRLNLELQKQEEILDD